MSISIETGPTLATAILLPEGNIARGDRALILSDGEALRVMECLKRSADRCESMDEAEGFLKVAAMLRIALDHPADRRLPSAEEGR